MGDVKTFIFKDSLSSGKQGATRAERSATVTSVIDSKSIRILASAIEKLITSRKGGLDISGLEKTLIRVLNASLKATGQIGGVSKGDLRRVAKEAGRVIAKEFVDKIVTKQIKVGKPGFDPSTSAMTKAIENGIRKAAGIIAKETAKASRGKVVIDDKLLAASIKSAIVPIIPKALPQAREDITKSFTTVKKLMRELDSLGKSIASMRKSGGGIDVMEMPKVLANLKKVAADAIELGKALTQTKNSIKTMVGESSDSFKELSVTIDNVKKSVKETVADIRRKASEDRIAFTKEVFGEVRKIFASKAFKDTELARIIKSLEGKIGTVGDLASAFKSIGAEFKKAVKESTIKIENVDQIINKFDHLISDLNALPDKMSVEGIISPEYKKFLKTLEGFSKGIKKVVSEVKLVIDDSELKKLQKKGIKIKADVDVSPVEGALKKLEDTGIELPVDVNKRSIDVTAQDILKTIQKAVSEAVDNALKYPKQLKLDIETQALKTELKELESAVSDVSLNRVQKVISSLGEMLGSGIERLEYASKKINDLLEYNARKAAKLRKEPEELKAPMSGLGSIAPISDRYKLLKETLTIPTYKETVIGTGGVGGIKDVFDELSYRTRITDMNRQLLADSEQGMNELSASLKRLQISIIEGLDRTFKEASSGWGVVRAPGEQDPSKIFKRTERQWTMDIADVSRLQRRFKGVGGDPKELVEAYMKEKIAKMEAPTDVRVMADAIGRWLKQTSENQIRNWDVNIKDVESQLIDIQSSIKGVAPDEASINRIVCAFGTSLESIFRNTFQRAEAKRMMQNEKLIRTITLPLATLTPQGIPAFQTTHGSLRALPKFAQFISGFEDLHSKLEKGKVLQREKGYARRIKEVGIMPTDRDLFLAENLASNMIKDLASASKESRAFILSQFKEAGMMRGVEVARAKQLKGMEFESEVKSFSLNINKIVDAFGQMSFGNLDDLISTLEKTEVSAYDLVRSLDQIKFENVYDIYRKILVPEAGVGPVERLGKEPRFERSIREYEQAVSQLTGLFPLIERGRPRRALHQSNIVNMLTRTGSIYGGKDVMAPAQQKTFIKDLNLRLGEMVSEAQALQKMRIAESPRLRRLPTGVSALSSLGVPEEQAGKIEEYRRDTFTQGTRFLKELNATAIKMYSDTLSELAPFGAEFQQIGRNISNVTNAMIDITGGAGAAFPKLVTEKERGIVEAGFYGKKGYGFNVIAELRNTAATFEDQVIVSGKLADAVTSAVSILVTPSPGGRVGAPPSEAFGIASEEMEMKAGQILKSNVEEAAREFQKILGVPKRYPGRADVALIESVKKVLTVVRGEDIEVQQAKIAETFLNYFGRKFTTRYGAKGVGITPTRPAGQILGEAYEKYGIRDVQVLTGKEREKAGLGVARLPKSMGELVAEVIEENVSALKAKGYTDVRIEETKKLFIESGNKFLLDIFKDVEQGIVTAAGAIKSKKIFEKYKNIMDILYDDPEVVGQFEEILRLKKRWEEALKEQGKFYKEVPIDIRISAYGLAKRGLQTEILETVMNNIIGVGAGQTVLSTKMKQEAYSRLLGGPGQRGLLSQYSEALGFKGVVKPPEVITKEMMGKKPYEEARRLKETLRITPSIELGPEATKLISEYDTTMRAAILESTSNYYSEVIDEIGKRRKSLVGEKFIQIIEEPHFDPGWALGQIEKGIKGERLDIPAYSAYATIFGEQSAMMKEIQESMTLNTKKHWEYLKALQFLNKESTEMITNLQKGLEVVDIKDIKAFDYSTGIYDIAGISPRSFKETILDIEKRPSPFMLGLPTAEKGVTEPFYVPGALARETYPEPLVAGERGIGDISRRLVHVVNMAKKLQEVLDQPEQFIEAREIRRALPKIIPQQIKVFWKAVRAKAETPELEAAAQELINKWFKALSGVAGTRVDQLIAPGFQATEQEYISSVLKRQFAKVQAGEKTKLAAYATTLGAMSDLLVGPGPETIKKFPEKAKASKIMETYISIGKGGEFAQTLGIDLSENVIRRNVENLEKAKIDYYNTLAETALGKKGSVEEVFFSRKIPAIMGRAVTAVVDKTEDLKNFAKELDKIEKELGKSLGDERQALNDLILAHQTTVGAYKERVGLPVLKQHELGVPVSFAKKVPVEFEKRYEVKDTMIKEAEKGTEMVKGTLYDMLKYIGDLRAATNYEDNKLLIDKYIKDALAPFIESVRFPFTGVSSVQPYEAKLVKDLDKFAENVLMVPGVPELDLDKFKSIISSLEEHMKSLVTERELFMGRATAEDLLAAENLTKTINIIDKAISEVTPRYVAHQQKLDFDGDQIEIHAAKTKEARQEIARHLQYIKGTELTTERVFRERFTAGAVVGPTGEFTLAEMAKTFEKKFPVEKGFDFLKTPFLTKELEYLTPEESLGMLAERKGMDPTLTLSKVVQGVIRNREAYLSFAEEMKKLGVGKTPKEILSAANLIAKDIEGIDEKIVQSAIKTQLYNEKYKDAIEAQLFKIHTGIETQALYRLHRLAELTVGFGPGQIGKGGYKPSPSFKGKFPPSYEKITGVSPEKEFHTMINEMVRFAIQKGMDVKHAGTVPVAGKMVKLIARGRGGIEELWKDILDESDSSYSELRDFYEANEAVIRRRAGGMKTGELVSALSEMYRIEDLPEKELVGLGRKELIDKIVEQFGLKGFLNRLSDIVYEEAVNGLILQVETWTPETRAGRGVRGNVRSWAESYVKKQMEDIRGISIRDLIEEAYQPLYAMRTGMATPKEELRKFKAKFGDLPMAEFPAAALSKDFRQEYMDKYQRAKATAKNIQRELEMFASSSQGGAYADMLRATSKIMLDEQAQIEEIVSGLEKRGYDIDVEAGKSLVDRALKSIDKFPEYIRSILEIPDTIKKSKAIEELFKLASIPQITETEETARRFELYPTVFKEAERLLLKEKGYSRAQFDEEEFERLLEDKANELLDRAMNLAQIDRALKAMSKKVYESRVLTGLLPPVAEDVFISTKLTEAQKGVMATAKERITRAKYGPKAGGPPGRPAGLPSGIDVGVPGIGKAPPFGVRDVVPVRIVSVDSGVTIGISGISGKDLVNAITGKAAIQPEMDPELLKKFDALTEADIVIGQLLNKLKFPEKPEFGTDLVSMFERFTAGGLAAGGKAYKKEYYDPERASQNQVEAITDLIMKRIPDPDDVIKLHMALGTAIHEKVQRRLSKEAIEQGTKFEFEKLIEDIPTEAGPISGFADVVEYGMDKFGKQVVKKVADIKTVSEYDISEMKKAAGDVQRIPYEELFKKIEDPRIKSKLETAISQINVYLKGLADQSKLRDEDISEYIHGELLFYDKFKEGEDKPFIVEVGYSEERFRKDISALIKAREIATKELEQKGIRVTPGEIPKGTKATTAREYMVKRGEYKPSITDEELNKLINAIATSLKEKQRGPVYRKLPSKEYSGLSGKVEEVIKGIKEEEDRAKLYAKTSYAKFIEPTPIAAGEGIKSVLENLRSLHDQALLYQQGKMLDFSVLKDFDKTIQEVITQVGKEGKSASLLIEAIDNVNALAADPKERIQGRDLMKLWKLYRIARGDWLLKKAEQARKDLEEAEKAEDWREANRAYGALESAVKETQRFVVGSLGKMSDIYTEEKRFVYPGLAQAAGVYKDPRQIAISAAGPLGESEELQRVFKNLTRDLGTGREVVAPIDKIRSAFRDLTGMQKDMVDLLTNAEKLKRVGPEVIEAWDFSKLAGNISRLRTAMDQLAKYNEFEADKRANLDFMRKYLKKLETTYAHLNLEMRQTVKLQREWGQLDLMPVSKFEAPTQQLALHERNVQKIREYFKIPEEMGGPKEEERFSYPIKVFGDTGEIIKSVIVQFRKYGEGLTGTGELVGKFAETQKDMIEWMQRSGASFKSALRRVVMWGAASRLVYGGIAKLKSSLDEISGIEVSVAQLRMVMSPLETDFIKLQKAAVGFAKTYGLGVNDVLVSMKVFAQQGLTQEEVIDRTRVATLAANVTTLDSKAATEALTAAMKIFREEGTSAVRFLDAWSETEAKHAITAADMANAIKKSAAAAKTAGVTFDELNGIVAAIGSVTRQSGKEVGTAMRFIFRRLFSEKGPKELAKIGIPAITGMGELRRGFEVLNDLAGQWKDLTQAQKLNLAQSLGGTRQYNALIVLMDQWDEALRGIRNSTNSKGSAERRNLEIMKTYAKQLQQTKASVTELKMEFGKIILPSFKMGLKALRMVLETVNAIPTTVKAAAVALGSLFVLGAKGINVFSGTSKYFERGKAEIANFVKEFSNQMKIAKFELTGKGIEKDIFGLKTALPLANKVANLYKPVGAEPVKMGKKWSDFHSIVGASVFKLREWGLTYNKFLGDLGSGTGKVFKSSGDALQDFAKKLDKFDWKMDLAMQGVAQFIPGRADDILAGIASVGVEATEQTSKYLGKALGFTGKKFGKGAESWLKSFAAENTNLVKALLPLGATMAAGAMALSKLSDKFAAATKSAQDFEKTMYGARRKSDSELKVIRELSQQYEILAKKLEDVNKAAKPETKARRQELGTYEAPLKTMRGMQQDLIDLSNSLADQNVSLVSGYNELGNAVLRSSANFGYSLKELDKVKVQDALETEIKVINQYVRALTDIGSSEKIKKAFKDLAASMPIVGGLVSKQIKVAPALVLKEASKELNRLINIKNKYPLSTAVDEDIQRLQAKLTEARNVFKEAYSDLSRVFSDAFSKAALKGLNRAELEKLFTRPELLEVFKVMVKMKPEFSLVKGIKPEDLMAKELLQVIFPQTAGVLDVDKVFTVANFESMGKKISDGLKRGSRGIAIFKFEERMLDTIWDREELARNLRIAGSQAILEFKQTTDGVYDWVATYFNTKTLQVEEVPFSEISKFADAIFPLDSIKEDLTYRMDALNTFVAGAAAGLTGVSVKDFKRDFDLGARFFSQIPTTLLLQGGKGFTPREAPGARYGPVKGMEKWGEEIKRFYFKPMEDLKTRLETVSRLQAPGLEDSVTLTAQFHSEVQKLLTVLKNNQVVFQFRAVFVDLMREFAESERVLRQNLAVQKKRNELDVETSGLMAGISKSLLTSNLGTRKLSELSPHQRLLLSDEKYKAKEFEIKRLETTLQSNLEMIDKVERALVDLADIEDIAKGFDVVLDPSQMDEFVEKVSKLADPGKFEKLIDINKNVATNTKDTVTKLDELIENIGTPESIHRIMKSSFTDSLQPMGKTVTQMERVARVRAKAEGRDDTETIITANKALDVLSKRLLEEKGWKEATKAIKQSTALSGRVGVAEFQQRLFAGMKPETFFKKMGKYGVERPETLREYYREPFESSELLKDLKELQKESNKRGLLNARNIATASASLATFTAFEKYARNKNIDKLDEQIKNQDKLILQRRERGGDIAIQEREVRGLVKEREALVSEKGKIQKKIDFYGLVSSMSMLEAGTTQLAMAMGLSEGQVKALGIGALGTYAAVKFAASMFKEDLPDSVDEFGAKLKEVSKAVITKEKPDISGLKTLGKTMVKDIEKRRREVTGLTGKEIREKTSEVDVEALRRKYQQDFGDLAAVTKRIKESAVPGKDYSEEVKKQFNREIENIGERIRKEGVAGPGVKRLQQALATFATATFSDYLAGMFDKKVLVSTLEKATVEQTELTSEIFSKWGDAAEKALLEMYADIDKAVDKVGKLSTTTRTTVLNVEENAEEIREAIEEYGHKVEKATKDAQKRLMKSKVDQAMKNAFEADRKAIGDLLNRFMTDMISFDVSRQFRGAPLLNKALEGFAGEIELPVSRRGMSVQQRIFANADKGLRKVLSSVEPTTMQIGLLAENLEYLQQQAKEEMLFIERNKGVFFDPYDVDEAQDRYKELQKTIKKRNKELEKEREVLRSIVYPINQLNEFSRVMYTFKDALEDLTFTEAVDGMKNFKASVESYSKLFGGAHPLAPTAITMEQEFQAAQVGIPLRHMVSTKYEVREAELMTQLLKASGEEKVRVSRQLYNLPGQIQRDIAEVEQRQEVGRLTAQRQPFSDMVRALEKFKITPELPFERIREVTDVQKSINLMLRRSVEETTGKALLEELDENKGVLTNIEYESAKANIEAAGMGKQLRGFPIWEQKGLGLDEMKEALEAGATIASGRNETALKDLVGEPITKKLDLLIKVTEGLAERFGVELHKDKDISPWHERGPVGLIKTLYKKLPEYEERKSSGYSRWTGLPTSEKAFGGRVFGAGGPKEDRVPAMLSSGEYVVKTGSAKKLGYANLEHINREGTLPGFQEGGVVEEKKKSFLEKLKEKYFGKPEEVPLGSGTLFQTKEVMLSRTERYKEFEKALGFAEGGVVGRQGEPASLGFFENLSKNLGEMRSVAKKLRLEGADEVAEAIESGNFTAVPLKQAALAASEILSAPIKGLLDLFSMGEKAGKYFKKTSMSDIFKDISTGVKMAPGIAESLIEQIKSGDLTRTLKSEIASGGTGLAGFAIETAIPSGLVLAGARKIKVGGKAIKEVKHLKLVNEEIQKLASFYPTNVMKNLSKVQAMNIGDLGYEGLYNPINRQIIINNFRTSVKKAKAATAHEYGHFLGDTDYRLYKSLENELAISKPGDPTISNLKHKEAFVELYKEFNENMCLVRKEAMENINKKDMIKNSGVEESVSKIMEKEYVPEKASLRGYLTTEPSNIGISSEMLSTSFEELMSGRKVGRKASQSVKLTKDYLSKRSKFNDLIEKFEVSKGPKGKGMYEGGVVGGQPAVDTFKKTIEKFGRPKRFEADDKKYMFGLKPRYETATVKEIMEGQRLGVSKKTRAIRAEKLKKFEKFKPQEINFEGMKLEEVKKFMESVTYNEVTGFMSLSNMLGAKKAEGPTNIPGAGYVPPSKAFMTDKDYAESVKESRNERKSLFGSILSGKVPKKQIRYLGQETQDIINQYKFYNSLIKDFDIYSDLQAKNSGLSGQKLKDHLEKKRKEFEAGKTAAASLLEMQLVHGVSPTAGRFAGQAYDLRRGMKENIKGLSPLLGVEAHVIKEAKEKLLTGLSDPYGALKADSKKYTQYKTWLKDIDLENLSAIQKEKREGYIKQLEGTLAESKESEKYTVRDLTAIREEGSKRTKEQLARYKEKAFKADDRSLLEYIKSLFRTDKAETKDDKKKQEGITTKTGGIFDWIRRIMYPKESAPVKHFGGPLTKTGYFFGEKGEHVIPKEMNLGGLVDDKLLVGSLNTGTGKILEVVLKKGQTVEVNTRDADPLPVDRTPLPVEETELSIAGIENGTLKVDAPDSIPVTGIPDSGIPINIPVGGIDVKISSDDVASKIGDAVKSAMSGIGAGVGAEKMDEIARAIAVVDGKLINVTTRLNTEIEMVKTSVSNLDIEGKVNEVVTRSNSDINRTLNEINTDIAHVEGDRAREKQTLEYKLSELERKLSTTMNRIGSLV